MLRQHCHLPITGPSFLICNVGNNSVHWLDILLIMVVKGSGVAPSLYGCQWQAACQTDSMAEDRLTSTHLYQVIAIRGQVEQALCCDGFDLHTVLVGLHLLERFPLRRMENCADR